jgi:hypothetical protein
LRELKVQHNSVWAAPTTALFAPAVSLSDLCYTLSQLACVEGVFDSLDRLPRELPVTNFPADLTAQAPVAIHAPVTDDDDIPQTCTVEKLLRCQPTAVLR